MKRIKNMIFPIIFIVIGIAIDQLTKYIVFKNFSDTQTYNVIKPIFKFDLVRNTGAAFGTLDGQQWLFIIITVIALGIFVYLSRYVSFAERPIYTCCYILFVIGCIGNFIDRIALGYVRDFITFGFFSFPSFNFADMCMTLGVIILVFDLIFGDLADVDFTKKF